MPQLDPTFFVSQLFWLGVSFALLFVLMQFWALPSVTKVIEKREKVVEGDLQQAEKLQTEIQRLNEATEQTMRSAKAEATAMIKQALSEMRGSHHAQEKELTQTLTSHIKAAEEKMLAAKNEALKDIEEASFGLAEDMIKRLTNTNLDSQVLRSEIKEALRS